MIDEVTIEKIKSAIDIIDVVSGYVELKKRGASYVGLCPFHEDHSPSLYVTPARNSWHCFVCDEGGDAISFVMKKEGISYPEALKLLSKKYSIEIPEHYLPKDEWIRRKQTEAMLAVNNATMQYYEACLTSSDDAVGMEYFRKRGFNGETLAKFHVGYAPKDSDIIGAVKDKGLKMKYLMPSDSDIHFKSGKSLHVENGVGTIMQLSGRFVDCFAGRVIFPWFNVKGDVVAFGGRKLDQATHGVEKKYRNSPDSLVYHKSRELWGLYHAKSAIMREGFAYITEGYTDVMMLHQIGIENVVGNSGIALSSEQANFLSRYTKNIVLLYDSDAAGINAAKRAIHILLQQGLNVSVILLPEGEDPDSFARQHTTDEVKDYLTAHKQDFVAFLCSTTLNNTADIVSRAEAINAILSNISLVKDDILRELYVKELSDNSGVAEDVLRNQIDVNETDKDALPQH